MGHQGAVWGILGTISGAPGGHLGQVGAPGAAGDELDGDVGRAHALAGRPVGQLSGLAHTQPQRVVLLLDEVQPPLLAPANSSPASLKALNTEL